MSSEWTLPLRSSMSARRIPPVSLMRLSERRRRVSEALPSSASIIDRAPSSPILVLPRSRCVIDLFCESTPARLTPTSSPRGLLARLSDDRRPLLQSVSAQASPPYSVMELWLQLHVWRLRLASRAFARAMHPLSCMSVRERSREVRRVLAIREDTMLETPLGPMPFVDMSSCSRPLPGEPRHCPIMTPTSGPAPFLLRSSTRREALRAIPSRRSTHPAVPRALLLTQRTSRVELQRNIWPNAAAVRLWGSWPLSCSLLMLTPLMPRRVRVVFCERDWPKATPTRLLKRLG
mmetsp:Transcript_29615/g.75022  ORF Transcript_29615/g.75022 Transcript_29615/m.75022 type:complete len:291 (-) Transcript_29615:469-1341(-)